MVIAPIKNKKDLKDIKTVSGDYHEIKDWRMDPRGYFLIKVDKRRKMLVAAHCKKLGVIDLVIQGKKPQDIYFEIHKRKLLSRVDHAAYVGKELEKAYLSLKYKLNYVQDQELEI